MGRRRKDPAVPSKLVNVTFMRGPMWDSVKEAIDLAEEQVGVPLSYAQAIGIICKFYKKFHPERKVHGVGTETPIG